jgi:acyl carrier protein
VSAAPAALSESAIRERLFGTLRRIAPEADPAAIDPAADLRQQLDVDSMDFLNFLVGIHESLGVDVPESDAAKLRSIDAIVAYVSARLPAPAVSNSAPPSAADPHES